ncbi:MAG: tetratricopeptide repeat protein [Bdellovibrio bacteriovorus]
MFQLPVRALVALALCLPAVAAASVQSEGTEVGPGPVEPDSAKAPEAAAAPPPEAGKGGLDSDLVYAVLVAELAARSGDLATAFTHYLQAAERARDAKLAELAVRAAVTAGDDAAMERGVTLWLALAPESVGAHQVAALLRIKAGDREGVLTHLSRVVQIAGADAAAGYNHAVGILSRMEDKRQRVDLMRALVDLDADNPEAHQALAAVAASAGDTGVAEAAARRALELRPDWSKPQMFLVRLMLSQGKREEARGLLEGYVAARPEDQALRLLYGQFLIEEKEFSNARREFEHLLGNQPKEPDVLFAAAILSLQLDDVDAARIYFTRLYQTGERRDEATFYLGQVEERAGHPAAAVDWYVKASGSSRTEAQVRIAVIRAKQGDVARAREVIQQLRDQSPGEGETLYLVEAEILAEVGRKDEAMAAYAAALEAYPDSADVLYARALFAVKLDQIDLAEADLRRVIAADPNHADALNALGYTLADRTDRYQEALALIEKAYALKPDEPAILDSMGWVHYRLGNPELALDYLRRALDALSDGEIAAHLGEVLWALGRRDEAWKVWESALKDHPEHEYLLEVVGRHRVTQSETQP